MGGYAEPFLTMDANRLSKVLKAINNNPMAAK
jgi:hypothetical protein